MVRGWNPVISESVHSAVLPEGEKNPHADFARVQVSHEKSPFWPTSIVMSNVTAVWVIIALLHYNVQWTFMPSKLKALNLLTIYTVYLYQSVVVEYKVTACVLWQTFFARELTLVLLLIWPQVIFLYGIWRRISDACLILGLIWLLLIQYLVFRISPALFFFLFIRNIAKCMNYIMKYLNSHLYRLCWSLVGNGQNNLIIVTVLLVCPGWPPDVSVCWAHGLLFVWCHVLPCRLSVPSHLVT